MTKYICDGHEYRIINRSSPTVDMFEIRNNYGTGVAILFRDETQEYWHIESIVDGGEHLASIHENACIDNLLGKWAVQQYVAWATDNDTVEEHS